jgi:outer membrane biogenesis lipoprotein LolB
MKHITITLTVSAALLLSACSGATQLLTNYGT